MYFTKMVFCVLLMVLILHTVLADPINTTLSMDEMQQRCASLLEIHGHYFLLDETKTVAGIPDDMHVHGKSGDIYYTLINGEADLEVYVISKQTGLEKKINVAGGQSTAIDNTNNIVYFATENGVYKQKDDGSTELYAASGADVIDISLTKDGSIMYIATFPKYDVHKITQNGKNMENVSAISYGRAITVDTEGNLIFTDLKMAYVLQAGQTVPKKIEGLTSDKLFDFCINKDNEVLAMDGDSQLYHVDVHAASATYWGSFGLPVSNTFAVDDDNNMYIGIEGAIKKFKHYNENPCTKA